MSEAAKRLFGEKPAVQEPQSQKNPFAIIGETIQTARALVEKRFDPGWNIFAPEMRRMGSQGSMELASALFSGNAFVPYGPGQYTDSPTIESSLNAGNENEQESGRSR